MPSIDLSFHKHGSSDAAKGYSKRTRPPFWTYSRCAANSSGVLQSRERERDRHTGLKMSKCGFSSLNLFSALTWSARCPRSRSQSQIHCHTCTQSECASSLPARRRERLRKCHIIGSERLGLSSGMLLSTIDPGSGCAPPRPASSAS